MAEHVSSVRVGSFGSRAEAEVARGMLETSGVPAVVLGGDGGGVHPGVGDGDGGIALVVHPDDVAVARELLDDVAAPLGRRDRPGQGWRPLLLVSTALVLVALLALGNLPG